MTTIPLDCPHCGTKKSGFAQIHGETVPGTDHHWKFLMCSNAACQRPVVVLCDPHQVEGKHGHKWLREMYPTASKSRVPSDVPESAEKAFQQGLDTLTANTADPAGAMFRKALDRGIHDFGPTLHKNLGIAIDELAESGSITEAMREWAHEIRDLGNDAVHNDFNFEEAKEMRDFAEVFLTYLFSMPAKIKRRRQKAAEAKAAVE